MIEFKILHVSFLHVVSFHVSIAVKHCLLQVSEKTVIFCFIFILTDHQIWLFGNICQSYNPVLIAFLLLNRQNLKITDKLKRTQ